MIEDPRYYTLSAEETLETLSVGMRGLSRTVARERLAAYGSNTFQEREDVSLFRIFLRQFLSPFVYLLCIAAGISFALGHHTDAYIILAAVLITVGFGFWQEAKAEKTIEALRKLSKNTATVVRDGRKFDIDAKELVPGDIIVIEEGDRISADARIVEEHDLEVDESALTGESIPQRKFIEAIERKIQISDQENMIFRGTVVSRGRGLAVVVHTGTETELGKIAKTVLSIGRKATPLQEGISHLAYILTGVIVVVLSALVVFGFLHNMPLVELLTTAIAVAVAAIPESLVVAVTVILVIGMIRLVKKQALVRKLVSAETLGGTTVVCVDKTGTVTRGEMSIGHIETDATEDIGKRFALTIGMAANDGYIEKETEATRLEDGTIKAMPTDKAFLSEGIKIGLGSVYEDIRDNHIDTIPFSSEYKYAAELVYRDEQCGRLYLKGAPDKVIEFATKIWKGEKSDGSLHVRKMSESDKQRLEQRIEELTSQGYRLMAVAYKDISLKGKKSIRKISEVTTIDDLVFVGFVGIIDPVRIDVAQTIRNIRRAGVRVIMITGDHKLTAQSVAKKIGMDYQEGHILDGSDFQHMDKKKLSESASRISIYSRIIPNDKLKIIRALQESGEIVAMTGDGVNDAPALKQADVGVAMGSGQDVAKEAADLIVLDDNFGTILSAIKEGRVILDNIRKVVLYLLKDTFSEIILLGSAIIAGLPLPILAAQVLWINVVEDALPAFSLSYEPAEGDVLKLRPEGKKRKLLTAEMNVIIFVVGITTDFLLLGMFLWFNYFTPYTIDYIRTLVFAGLALNSLIVIFSLRSLRHSVFSIPLFDNLYLLGSVAFGILMLMVAIYIPPIANLLRLAPISGIHWIMLAMIALVEMVLVEITKSIFTHHGAPFRIDQFLSF